MKADIADPFTSADIRVRDTGLTATEEAQRATATVCRHAVDRDDAARLLAMLGLTPSLPAARKARKPRKPPKNPGRVVPPAAPTHWPCVDCGRGMWHKGWSDSEKPGRIAYGAHNLCCTCYQRWLKNTRTQRLGAKAAAKPV